MSGYDSAKRLRKDDDLGRWRFGAEIADVIRSTPSDWSARIGIFGKWGEGKSTVLHFLEEMLKPEGNIVFYFTPWAIQELDELWAEFGNALLEALKQSGVDAESPWKDVTRKVQGAIDSSGLGEVGETIAGLWGKDKIYKGALGFVSKWLKADGTQVQKIRERLGNNQRVVVLIDDLDRATPELLPKLLLALREILDLPGFTFVLAFDNEIVADGLTTANKAWGDGDNFLDKILDFEYYLPKVSKAQKNFLLENMLGRYADFVPRESVGPIEHLLPDNPRKLKRLIRGLVSLSPQLKRHRPDELNWVEIWLAEMIRQESNPFFIHLLDGKLDTFVGIAYRFLHNEKKNKGQDNEANDADIRKVINEVGGINEKQTERLIELIKATRVLAGMHLEYNWKFALRPEAITWKEYDELRQQWVETPTPETLSGWIGKQSGAVSIEAPDVERDLLQTLINVRDSAVSAAADTTTSEGNAAKCAEATSLLTMTQQLLDLPGIFSPEAFSKLYGKASYWIAFRMNPGEEELRRSEKTFLLSLLHRANDDEAPALFDVLKPWDPWAFTMEDSETAWLKKELSRECLEILTPKAERALITYLNRPDVFRVFRSGKASQTFQYLLFHRDHLPWSGAIRSAMQAVVKEAKSDDQAYEKANDFLQLLIDAQGNQPSCIGFAGAEEIAKDREFMQVLWSAVTSRHIQYRMLKPYLSKRAILLKFGANAEDLPLPPELEQISKQLDQSQTEAESM